MIASKDEEVLRVLDLVRQQQTDRLQALLATVDVVPSDKDTEYKKRKNIKVRYRKTHVYVHMTKTVREE